MIALDGEDQVALRDGRRYGLRLERAESSLSAPLKVSGESAYLITGGLGALGQHLARWLVSHGAKRIVLTSRTGVSSRSIKTIQELEATGATITVVKADAADEAQMTALIQSFGESLPVLGGVIHAAGVVSTQPLDLVNEESLRSVLRPKVTGAWLLHRLTQNLNLDFFVLFSSSAAILGSSNLGHYAAANHFLDTLAHIRHDLNLPALSINWGWWGGAGMATSELEKQFRQIGQEAMPVDSALQALEVLICSKAVHKMVASIDWNRFKPIYQAKHKHPLIERIQVQEELQNDTQATLADQLFSIPAAQRLETLQAYVQSQVAQVLGLGASDKLDPRQGFFTIGMDLVMATQLRVRLETNLGQALPSTVAFEYPTVETLTSYLSDEVLKLDANRSEVLRETQDGENRIQSQEPLNEEDLLSKLDDELAAFNKLVNGD